MKKYLIGLGGTVALAAFVALPAHAATVQGKLSTGSVTTCNTRKTLVDGTQNDIDLFRAQYFTEPNAEDLVRYYPLVKAVDLNNNNPQIHSPIGTVPVIKKGVPTTVKRTNYGLVLKYHRASLALAKQAGVNVAKYEKILNGKNGLADAIDANKSFSGLPAVYAEWGSARAKAGGINCTSKTGQTNALSLIRQRNAVLKKLEVSRKKAATKSKQASDQYRDFIKPAYIKKLNHR